MQVKKTPLNPLPWLAGVAILSVALAQPALAADLFAHRAKPW